MPRKLYVRKCINCKNEFETILPKQTACSTYCRTIFNNKRDNAAWIKTEYVEPEKRPHQDSDKVAYSFFRKGRMNYPQGYKSYRG